MNIPAGDDWQARVDGVMETVREMSRQTDPQEMVRAYGDRVRQWLPMDAHVSLSRRGLERPKVRVTRSSTWREEVNPWKQAERLPVVEGGLLAELIWEEKPRIIDDLRLEASDPAAAYFGGCRSLMALPHFHEGAALNMVVHLRREPGAFDPAALPELLLTSNLFGRATNNLVLSARLKEAYESLDRELKAVEEIQRSLLPPELPRISGLELAAHYQTSRRAGGDYYDFFPLPEGKWGVFIADVSGHGTPSAVLMAITHAIAHGYPGPVTPPGEILAFLNRTLARRYTNSTGNFVTAFYGVYDPAGPTLRYARAGHNPPRWARGGRVVALEAAGGLPLGIMEDETFDEAEVELKRGDRLVFYTDGITETFSPGGEMFDVERLDEIVSASGGTAREVVKRVLEKLEMFTAGRPVADDRTLVVGFVR